MGCVFVWLEFHGGDDAEIVAVADGSYREVVLLGKRTGEYVGAAGSYGSSGEDIPPVVFLGVGTGPTDLCRQCVRRNTEFPAVATLHEGCIGKCD